MKAHSSLPYLFVAILLSLLPSANVVRADEAQDKLRESESLFRSGMYFKAARYAFAASSEEGVTATLKAQAYSQMSLSLVRAGLYNSASYFYIRTLQTQDRASIRRALVDTETLLMRVGVDLFRKYLIRHTTYDDYDARNRSAYLFALGKEAILQGKAEQALGYLNGVQSSSAIWPIALQLRGAAHALLNKNEAALADFRLCESRAGDLVRGAFGDAYREKKLRLESDDLAARCLAGEARTLYQMERFDDADRTYDRISKMSYVWPDILFEQAWNSYGRREYNRSLGKLVSYKSPALSFVFNPEVDVLRAQSYLALCLYSDANDVINEFNNKYTHMGQEVKRLVEGNSQQMSVFYDLGKGALSDSLYSRSDLNRLMNRFVRSPYFQNLVRSEYEIQNELELIRQFDRNQPGVSHDRSEGFPGFLDEVLRFRGRSIKQIGGAFVKNSLIDYHSYLISDFEMMSFIKLEMLKQAKEQIIMRNRPMASSDERQRGNVEPSRKSYQYYWSFNGEFWNDELGDYVFGLESECGKSGA